jgi:hypothetical protein
MHAAADSFKTLSRNAGSQEFLLVHTHIIKNCPGRVVVCLGHGLGHVGPFHVSPFLRIRIQIVTIFIQSGPRTAVDPLDAARIASTIPEPAAREGREGSAESADQRKPR